jgi:hypothetical protein
MSRYPKTFHVKVRRINDAQVSVTYDDSTGRMGGRAVTRGEDVSDLPRYVRDELDDWLWSPQLSESETTEDGR